MFSRPEERSEKVGGKQGITVEDFRDGPDALNLRLRRESGNVTDIMAAPQGDADTLSGAYLALQPLRHCELERLWNGKTKDDVGVKVVHGCDCTPRRHGKGEDAAPATCDEDAGMIAFIAGRQGNGIG